jgi:hypothetical protein
MNCPPHTSSALHADDLTIWHASENIKAANQNIQESLNAISVWTNNWGVKTNPFKTCILKKTYLGAIRPNLEYGMTAWATASKTSMSNLT